MTHKTIIALALAVFGIVVIISAYALTLIGQAGIWQVLQSLATL